MEIADHPDDESSTAFHVDNCKVESAQRNPDTLLATCDLAEILGVSSRTLEGWRVRGDGPAFLRLGRRRVAYRWSDIQAWLDSRVATSTSQAA